MKSNILVFLLLGSLTALAAWQVHVPNSVQADEVPEKYRDTVDRGLAFLAKNQLADGRWEGDGGKHPVAMTGLVGVALLMENKSREDDDDGPTPGLVRKGKHAANVKKAADWLMNKTRPSGLIFSDHPSETDRYLDSHGLATVFLAGALYEMGEPINGKSYEVLSNAVTYIVKSQSGQGGWYHTSKLEGHDLDSISSTVIQLQALQAAAKAGISVPGHTISDAKEYLRVVLDKSEVKNRARPVDVAGMLACWYVTTHREELKKVNLRSAERLEFCERMIPRGRNVKFGRDDLANYYYAQALHHSGRAVEYWGWNEYRTAMFDHLQTSQNKDGSWPGGSASEGGIGGGALYSTAIWCTVLQLDRKSHPCLIRANYKNATS